MFFYHPACEEGHFGTNCSQVCSPNCISATCRPADGLCTCAAGLTGRNCTTGTFLKIVLYNHITEMELSQLIHIILKQSLKHCKHFLYSFKSDFIYILYNYIYIKR